MKAAFNDHVQGLKLTFRAFATNKYWLWFLPGIIVLLLFAPLFLFSSAVTAAADGLNSVPLVGGFLSGSVNTIFGIFDFIVLAITQFFVLTVLSPFNGRFSEKLDEDLTGSRFDAGFTQVINDIGRGMLIALVAIMMEFLLLGLWMLFSWIVGLSFLNSFVYFLIASFFFGFAFYDYSLERHRYGLGASWGLAVSKGSYMILTGAVFQVLLIIPVLGIVIAPVFCTALATIVYLKMKSPTGKFPIEQHYV